MVSTANVSRIVQFNFLSLCMLAVATSSEAQESTTKTVVSGPVKTIRADFQFTEGPTADDQGNLYFTDIPANRIYRMNADGKITVFLEPSGHCNGLMLNGNRLLACEMDGQLKSIDLKTKKVTSLVSKYNGKRFNAPNDLVIDKKGGIYFTDPRFRAPMPWPQKVEAVYYRSAAGKVTRLIEDLAAPNGVIMSPDEKTLYVVPSMQKQMWAYPIDSPGKIGKGRVLCELTQKKPGQNGGGDGLTIDTQGNLYITMGMGIEIISPNGTSLGIIEFPEQPANVTFGGKDRKTLYVTARKGLYSSKTAATGHVFPGQ
jgi:gluconolactonase